MLIPLIKRPDGFLPSHSGPSEIPDFRNVISGQKNVCAFKIHMDDFSIMQITHPLANSMKHFLNEFEVHHLPLLLQEQFEISERTVLHNEEKLVLLLVNIEQLNNIILLERGVNLHLSLENRLNRNFRGLGILFADLFRVLF